VTAPETSRTIEEYIAAWDASDLEKVLTYFADELVYEDMCLQHTMHTKDELRAFWQAWFDVVADNTGKIEYLMVDGEQYMFEWTVTGTLNGPFGPIQGTGQHIVLKGASVGTVRDGVIVADRDYWDLTQVLKQLGVKEIPEL